MMNKHLATTTDEVVARLNKKWDDDVRAFELRESIALFVARGSKSLCIRRCRYLM